MDRTAPFRKHNRPRHPSPGATQGGVTPAKGGATQSDVSPSFFFPLYLSLSSGTGREKEER
jgi:hypothetical protein